MKKTLLLLTLISSTAVPLLDSLKTTDALIKHANSYSKEMFNCTTTFKICTKELSTTISLLSSEIDKLLIKYNKTSLIKYVFLCCILRDMRMLCENMLAVISKSKQYGFTRFTWKLNKACDKKLANKICFSFRALDKRINDEEREILESILKEIDKIRLPGKIKLLGMLKFMRKL